MLFAEAKSPISGISGEKQSADPIEKRFVQTIEIVQTIKIVQAIEIVQTVETVKSIEKGFVAQTLNQTFHSLSCPC